MGILLEAVNSRKRVSRKTPLELKIEYVLSELKAMNVTVSRSGKPIEQLSYEALKEEWVFATICTIDITTDANKWY